MRARGVIVAWQPDYAPTPKAGVEQIPGSPSGPSQESDLPPGPFTASAAPTQEMWDDYDLWHEWQ